MLRPAVYGLFLACVVYLSISAPILDNGLPFQWSQTTTQVNDLPKTNNIVTPDPWNFLQRMSLYRLMIDATNPFMGIMGPNATDSPLWGLPLQLAWMLKSGRLADPTGATTGGDTTSISPKSWWACVNYYGSVLPFLSAASQGYLGSDIEIKMQAPEGVTDFCTTYAECTVQHKDAMTKWDAFFQGLKSTPDTAVPVNESKDALLGLYWAAQTASTSASATCNARQSYYTSTETAFANGWLNSAEFVSAARFQSSLEKSAKFISPLPSRILKVGDVAPNITDLSKEENETLHTFSWMAAVNNLLKGMLTRMWSDAMCSVATREKGKEMLEELLLDPTFATTSFMPIFTEMTASC